jgi:hypothetical protein
MAQLLEAAGSAMSFEPIELKGVTVDPSAAIKQCKFCGRQIWWGLTARGKRNPFDVSHGERTCASHWSTCRQRAQAQKEFHS